MHLSPYKCDYSIEGFEDLWTKQLGIRIYEREPLCGKKRSLADSSYMHIDNKPISKHFAQYSRVDLQKE